MTFLKCTGVLILGAILAAALSIATDFVLEYFKIFTPAGEVFDVWWMLVLAALYRSVYTALGAYVVAAISPCRPNSLIKIFAWMSVVGNLIGLITTWNLNLGPHWYPIALVLLAYPSAIIGGKMRKTENQ